MRALERLRVAHAASAAGDAMVAVSLAGTLFFDVPLGEARGKVALYLLLTMLPFSALSALIGPALDRMQGGARLGIIIAAAGRASLAVFMAGAFGSLLLYPYAFAVLVFSRTHALGRSALTPVLAQDEALVPLNARLTRSALLGGTVAGAVGAALTRISPGATLTAAAAAFALAGTAAMALPRGEIGPPQTAIPHNLARALSGRAQAAFVVAAWMRALGAFLLFLLAFALRALGHGSLATALALGAAGAGAFAASAVFPRLRRIPTEERVLVIVLFAGAAVSFIAFRNFSYAAAVAVAIIIGAAGNGARVAYDAVLQAEVAPSARGRAFARTETLLQVAWVAGAAVPTLIPLPIGLGLFCASAAFTAAGAWYLMPSRSA